MEERGSVEDIIEVTARFPWWLGVVLAVISYLLLHAYAISSNPAVDLNDSSSVLAGLLKPMAMIGQYILPALFIFGSLGSLLTRKKRNGIYQGRGMQPSQSKQSGVRRFLLIPIVIISTFIFVIILLKYEHSVVSTQLANILNVDTKIDSSVEMTSRQKQDVQGVTPDDGLKSISLIGLPSDDMSNEDAVKEHQKNKLLFKKWYVESQECLASQNNPNPDIAACVNRRMKARKEYADYLKE